jgi:large subunit ribosomal protein L20
LPPLLQVKYSQLIHGLKTENIEVNRKMLSELAMNEPYSFKALVDQVRFMRGGSGSSPAAAAAAARAGQ